MSSTLKRWAFLPLIPLAALDLALGPWAAFTVWTPVVRGYVLTLAGAATVAAVATVAARRGVRGAGGVADLAGLATVGAALPAVVTVATYLVVPYAPLADAWLSWPERAIGLPQPVVWHALASAGLLPWAQQVYDLIPWEVAAMCAYFLLVRRDTTRLWGYAAHLAVAAASAVVPWAALPAVGARLHYVFPDDVPIPEWSRHVAALHDGSFAALDDPQGLVCAPSFHVVFTTLITWAFRGEPVFWPVAVLNVLVAASAIPCGWHYVTDVAAGLLWSAVAVAVVARAAASRAEG